MSDKENMEGKIKENQSRIEFNLNSDECYLRVDLSKNSVNKLIEEHECRREAHVNAIGAILSNIVSQAFLKEANIDDDISIEELKLVRDKFEDFFVECIQIGLRLRFEDLKKRKLQ